MKVDLGGGQMAPALLLALAWSRRVSLQNVVRQGSGQGTHVRGSEGRHRDACAPGFHTAHEPES